MTESYNTLHEQALAFRTGWSITTDEWHWLAALTQRLGARRVLEFGPGYSTLALVAGGATHVDTYESSPTAMLDALRLAVPSLFLYDDRAITIHPHDLYDLAFVDGPAGNLCYYSRLNTLLCALDCAKTVVLHDSNRDGEQRTLEVVLKLGVEIVEQRHQDMGMTVLRRC